MILILIYILMPALVIWLCEKFTILNKLGPILLLYIVGAIIGNTGLMPESAAKIQDIMMTVIIPIAIPLMLFSCDFRRWDIRGALLTLLTGVFAVVVTIIAGYFIFKPHIDSSTVIGQQFNNIAGLMAGVYTGGTPNMAAIKIMLQVPNETYIMVHSYDMLISFIYMIFLLSVGVTFFRKVIGNKKTRKAEKPDPLMPVSETELDEHPYRDFFTRKNFVPLLGAMGVAAIIFAISGALSLLFPANTQIVVIILGITTLGIAASFINPVRRVKKSFDAGMYLIYIFSIVVASMADVTKLDLVGGFYIFLYIVFAIFGSLFLHLLLAKIFKLDSDTVVIASVALINSAPFVPMMAAAMKNKSVIISGLTIGLVGYAIGNYMGFIIANILKPVL
ncbi:MAG: DUF819 family protein [Rikenellaceae bacterium]|nr:DUF819 family protein [Rikenellaceae bacterium]